MHSERRPDKQSGIALVLTLLTISFLVAVTLQLMITVDRQITISAAQREQVRLDGMVQAGLCLARAALAVDQRNNTFDSPQDAWATLEPKQFKSVSDEVDLEVAVSDLSGRLQVNALKTGGKEAYRQLWLRFLTSGHFAIAGGEAAEDLLDAIADWIDEDNEERHGGAESPYYQGLQPPYACRNAPLATVEELLLVKGMTRALLFGDADHEGIANYITVLGDNGAINLNTAPLPVLQALSPEMTSKLAQELIDYRQDKQHVELLAQPGWYRGVSGFPAAIEFSNEQLVVAGQYFEVRVHATLNQFSRTGTGILHRGDDGRQTLLSWKLE
ncbi:MAG: type II secretion system minor pseudopilin GspK [Desulfobulbus sp.]|jgi:general secretion pathway protein K|uniref:type II secretion system minor pseudopilin GspK n=1 Tax=Desulfobulbus sp. TaxID=895 RepID=UPI00284EAE1A|nr:type II secretion system minor pseudopilin GspK [Desulfobulbus sp.]MDR2548857.1 type II secretion system minor pseudopilin GspK [Desulfobulbus sp.]